MIEEEIYTANFDVPKRPERAARALFFIRRHFLSFYIFISMLFALLISLFLVSNIRDIDSAIEHLVVLQFTLCILIFFVGSAPLILSATRIATISDLEAALHAADNHERPILQSRLEARLESRWRSDPLTTDELTATFYSVRAKYGKQARKMAFKKKATRATQRDFLERLKGSKTE